MEKKIMIQTPNGKKEKIVTYIPGRYIFAILLIILETMFVSGIVIALTVYVPYFYIASFTTQIVVSLFIANSDYNPDYKVPWLLFVILVPIVGYMLYFMFYRRRISKGQVKKLRYASSFILKDTLLLDELKDKDIDAYLLINSLTKSSNTNLYINNDSKYYSLGEEAFKSMINDLKSATKFIFLEYFIIEEGLFWNTILEILKEKVKESVEVRVLYDDIGCMNTLPGNYAKILSSYGIKALSFSRLRGQATGEFNNRSHRKILVIDGIIGYTGGINLADEYINNVVRFGHFKDSAIRITGNSVNELTKLFLTDFIINSKKKPINFDNYITDNLNNKKDGYIVPFGDGPRPVYKDTVSKNLILNMINKAKSYVYITTPYLIIDNEILDTICRASNSGIDIKIITPHIPDKKLVFNITRSHYSRLIKANVKIYEYEKGFIHAKTYLSDDKFLVLGTINLDYRSLVHHFENGVLLYNSSSIFDVKEDFLDTISKSIFINENPLKERIFNRFLRFLVKLISPLL